MPFDPDLPELAIGGYSSARVWSSDGTVFGALVSGGAVLTVLFSGNCFQSMVFLGNYGRRMISLRNCVQSVVMCGII